MELGGGRQLHSNPGEKVLDSTAVAQTRSGTAGREDAEYDQTGSRA